MRRYIISRITWYFVIRIFMLLLLETLPPSLFYWKNQSFVWRFQPKQMQRLPLEPFWTQEALINFGPRIFLHRAMHSERVQGSNGIANAESTGCASITMIARTVITMIIVNIFAKFSAMKSSKVSLLKLF